MLEQLNHNVVCAVWCNVERTNSLPKCLYLALCFQQQAIISRYCINWLVL